MNILRGGILKKTLVGALSLLICLLMMLSMIWPAFASSDIIRPRSVEISTTFTTVRVNQTKTLFADVYPRDATNQEIEWHSSNEEIVTVDDFGVLTGISPGQTTVWAYCENKYAKCEVTVPDRYMDIKLNTSNQRLTRGPNITPILSAVDIRADASAVVWAAAATNNRETRQPLVYNGKTETTTTALRSAAFAATAAGGTVELKSRTLDKSGAIQGQINMKPDEAPKTDSKIGLSVYTSAENTGSYSENARSAFGRRAAIVYLTHSGEYPLAVSVAAKVDLSGMDTAKLKIYTYNTATGSYKPIPNQGYRVDSAGFIHFTPESGGIIAIVEAK